MRTVNLTVNITEMGGSGALVWSVPAAVASPSAIDRGYCGGFGLHKPTHLATVRPLGSRGDSTG